MRFLLALSLLGIGCGPSSYDDFRSQLVSISCKREVRCGTLGASELAVCRVPPLAIQDSGRDVDAALKAGRLRFVSSGAQDCLNAVNGAPCDPGALDQLVMLRCHDVVQPNLEPGSPCFTEGECVGGYCLLTASGCAGVCKAFPPPGQPCVVNGPPEMSCDPTVQYCADPNTPDGGVPDGGTGGPAVCLRHKQAGDRCSSDEQCAFGLVCLGTCADQTHLHKGDLCTAAGTLCDVGIYCDSTGRCVPQKKAGEACETAEACQDKLACLGLTLGPNNKLVSPGTCTPWLDVGAPCVKPAAGMQTITGCPLDQTCASGTCTPLQTMPRLGYHQGCEPAVCGDGLYCDGQLCQFEVGLAGSCKASAKACAPPLTCDASQTCVANTTCR